MVFVVCELFSLDGGYSAIRLPRLYGLFEKKVLLLTSCRMNCDMLFYLFCLVGFMFSYGKSFCLRQIRTVKLQLYSAQ